MQNMTVSLLKIHLTVFESKDHNLQNMNHFEMSLLLKKTNKDELGNHKKRRYTIWFILK